MRAYELMVIHDGDLDDVAVQDELKDVKSRVDAVGRVVRVDFWGKRRFAYEINHKHDGYYSVMDLLAEAGAMDPVERALRIADNVVRHKLIRLPDDEAERRGILVNGEPASAE